MGVFHGVHHPPTLFITFRIMVPDTIRHGRSKWHPHVHQRRSRCRGHLRRNRCLQRLSDLGGIRLGRLPSLIRGQLEGRDMDTRGPLGSASRQQGECYPTYGEFRQADHGKAGSATSLAARLTVRFIRSSLCKQAMTPSVHALPNAPKYKKGLLQVTYAKLSA